jgi:putative ABC transport system permease protein
MTLAPRMPLGLQILTHAPRRLLVSMAGMMLAALLMLSQIGFRDAMFDSQSEIINRLRGDLFIVSKAKYIMTAPQRFPIMRIYEARGVRGVRDAHPLYIESAASTWKDPETSKVRALRVLAFDPEFEVFSFPDLRKHAPELKAQDTVMFDTKSRPFYGRPGAGTTTLLARRPVTVVGTFELGPDFFTDGNVIMSDRNFESFFPDPASTASRLDRVDIGVVDLEQDARIADVKSALEAALPKDVAIFTRAGLVGKETSYWENTTAIGKIFWLGMVVGITVGVVICYQILHTNVSNYLPQFATLKAMGFTSIYLVGVVVQQAVFLAVLGFIPAVLAAWGLFGYVGGKTGLVMSLKWGESALVLLLTVGICLGSAFIAVRRVLDADPAEVFK